MTIRRQEGNTLSLPDYELKMYASQRRFDDDDYCPPKKHEDEKFFHLWRIENNKLQKSWECEWLFDFWYTIR